jgi:hypothetical protein
MGRDLLILAADRDIEAVIRRLLRQRAPLLGMRDISFDVRTHPHRDPGCANGAHEFLRPFLKSYDRALVLLDREGSGARSDEREELETRIERDLRRNGWADRCAAIAIDPELEAWVWSASPVVESVLGWDQSRMGVALRQWLFDRSWLKDAEIKPQHPKEALSEVLRRLGPRSRISLFEQLCAELPILDCEDSAFLKLRATLRRWFPATPELPA